MKQPKIYLQSYKISCLKYIHDKAMPKLRLKINLKQSNNKPRDQEETIIYK